MEQQLDNAFGLRERGTPTVADREGLRQLRIRTGKRPML
jgi:hypothetical protein